LESGRPSESLVSVSTAAGVLSEHDRGRARALGAARLEAARSPKQIWRIDTSHTHGLDARPLEYERRIVGFFDRALL